MEFTPINITVSAKLTPSQVEYLHDAAYGYLNGFHDEGADEYPPMTLEELKTYAWETIEWERDIEPAARAIYFAGKKYVMPEIERIILAEKEFSAIVTDVTF